MTEESYFKITNRFILDCQRFESKFSHHQGDIMIKNFTYII